MTLREAIERDHKAKRMPNSDRWISFRIFRVWVPVFPLFAFPETVRDVFLIHDAHHLITGYGTDFRGEMELNAWTLASGGYFINGAPWWLLGQDGEALRNTFLDLDAKSVPFGISKGLAPTQSLHAGCRYRAGYGS